jgi:hypothetical protein
MDDAELVKRIEDGEEAAFLVLYRRHCEPVHRFAWVILKSEADARLVRLRLPQGAPFSTPNPGNGPVSPFGRFGVPVV